MKTKEQLALEFSQQFLDSLDNNSIYEAQAALIGYSAGYEAATKWKKVEEELPNNDRTVLVWVNRTQNPLWSTYDLGSYIGNNWYLKGGRESHEIVTDWCDISKIR